MCAHAGAFAYGADARQAAFVDVLPAQRQHASGTWDSSPARRAGVKNDGWCRSCPAEPPVSAPSPRHHADRIVMLCTLCRPAAPPAAAGGVEVTTGLSRCEIAASRCGGPAKDLVGGSAP
jgi:hypothetical protein